MLVRKHINAPFYQSQTKGPYAKLNGQSPVNASAIVYDVIYWLTFATAVTAIIVGSIALSNTNKKETTLSKLTVTDTLNISGGNIASPVNPSGFGLYDVGFYQARISLSSGQSNVTILYPMKQGQVPRREIPGLDCSQTYRTEGTAFDFYTHTDMIYEIPSYVCAQKNGPIDTENGPYPIVIFHHGCCPDVYGGDYDHIYDAETLASYGFITATYNWLNYDGGADLQALINYISQTWSDAAHADGNNVGLHSFSNGGFPVQHYVNNFPHSHIKAVFGGETYYDNKTGFDMPIMGVNETEGSLGDDVPFVLDETSGVPRYGLTFTPTTHTAGYASLCEVYEACRKRSLLRGNPDRLVMPDNVDWTDFGDFALTYGDTAVQTDPEGIWAFYLAYIQSFFDIPAFVGFGDDVAACNKLGVGDRTIDTDIDQNGFTDPASYIVGTATAGAASTIMLESSMVVVNADNLLIRQAEYDTANSLNGYKVTITDGTGITQTRTISAWAGSPTYVATVSVPWSTVPDTTSVYRVTNTAGIYDRTFAGTFGNTNQVPALIRRHEYHQYMTSFFRVHLANDTLYAQFLTQEYAAKQPNVASLEIRTA